MKPDTDFEVDFTKSKGIVGTIYPIIKDQRGKIIDGVHRFKADPDWPSVTVAADRKKAILIRVHANNQRRQASGSGRAKQFNSLAQILRGEGMTGSLTEEVARLTGFSISSVQHLLRPEFKDARRSDAGKASVSSRYVAPLVPERRRSSAELEAVLSKVRVLLDRGILNCPDDNNGGTLVWSCCNKDFVPSKEGLPTRAQGAQRCMNDNEPLALATRIRVAKVSGRGYYFCSWNCVIEFAKRKAEIEPARILTK